MGNNTHGYKYAYKDTVWEGSGFSTRKEAQDRFQELIDGWINEVITAPKKFWQIWKSDFETPCIERHTF